jgi:hypothetical protein
MEDLDHCPGRWREAVPAAIVLATSVLARFCLVGGLHGWLANLSRRETSR